VPDLQEYFFSEQDSTSNKNIEVYSNDNLKQIGPLLLSGEQLESYLASEKDTICSNEHIASISAATESNLEPYQYFHPCRSLTLSQEAIPDELYLQQNETVFSQSIYHDETTHGDVSDDLKFKSMEEADSNVTGDFYNDNEIEESKHKDISDCKNKPVETLTDFKKDELGDKVQFGVLTTKVLHDEDLITETFDETKLVTNIKVEDFALANGEKGNEAFLDDDKVVKQNMQVDEQDIPKHVSVREPYKEREIEIGKGPLENLPCFEEYKSKDITENNFPKLIDQSDDEFKEPPKNIRLAPDLSTSSREQHVEEHVTSDDVDTMEKRDTAQDLTEGDHLEKCCLKQLKSEDTNLLTKDVKNEYIVEEKQLSKDQQKKVDTLSITQKENRTTLDEYNEALYEEGKTPFIGLAFPHKTKDRLLEKSSKVACIKTVSQKETHDDQVMQYRDPCDDFEVQDIEEEEYPRILEMDIGAFDANLNVIENTSLINSSNVFSEEHKAQEPLITVVQKDKSHNFILQKTDQLSIFEINETEDEPFIEELKEEEIAVHESVHASKTLADVEPQQLKIPDYQVDCLSLGNVHEVDNLKVEEIAMQKNDDVEVFFLQQSQLSKPDNQIEGQAFEDDQEVEDDEFVISEPMDVKSVSKMPEMENRPYIEQLKQDEHENIIDSKVQQGEDNKGCEILNTQTEDKNLLDGRSTNEGLLEESDIYKRITCSDQEIVEQTITTENEVDIPVSVGEHYAANEKSVDKQEIYFSEETQARIPDTETRSESQILDNVHEFDRENSPVIRKLIVEETAIQRNDDVDVFILQQSQLFKTDDRVEGQTFKDDQEVEDDEFVISEPLEVKSVSKMPEMENRPYIEQLKRDIHENIVDSDVQQDEDDNDWEILKTPTEAKNLMEERSASEGLLEESDIYKRTTGRDQEIVEQRITTENKVDQSVHVVVQTAAHEESVDKQERYFNEETQAKLPNPETRSESQKYQNIQHLQHVAMEQEECQDENNKLLETKQSLAEKEKQSQTEEHKLFNVQPPVDVDQNNLRTQERLKETDSQDLVEAQTQQSSVAKHIEKQIDNIKDKASFTEVELVDSNKIKAQAIIDNNWEKLESNPETNITLKIEKNVGIENQADWVNNDTETECLANINSTLQKPETVTDIDEYASDKKEVKSKNNDTLNLHPTVISTRVEEFDTGSKDAQKTQVTRELTINEVISSVLENSYKKLDEMENVAELGNKDTGPVTRSAQDKQDKNEATSDNLKTLAKNKEEDEAESFLVNVDSVSEILPDIQEPYVLYRYFEGNTPIAGANDNPGFQSDDFEQEVIKNADLTGITLDQRKHDKVYRELGKKKLIDSIELDVPIISISNYSESLPCQVNDVAEDFEKVISTDKDDQGTELANICQMNVVETMDTKVVVVEDNQVESDMTDAKLESSILNKGNNIFVDLTQGQLSKERVFKSDSIQAEPLVPILTNIQSKAETSGLKDETSHFDLNEMYQTEMEETDVGYRKKDSIFQEISIFNNERESNRELFTLKESENISPVCHAEKESIEALKGVASHQQYQPDILTKSILGEEISMVPKDEECKCPIEETQQSSLPAEASEDSFMNKPKTIDNITEIQPKLKPEKAMLSNLENLEIDQQHQELAQANYFLNEQELQFSDQREISNTPSSNLLTENIKAIETKQKIGQIPEVETFNESHMVDINDTEQADKGAVVLKHVQEFSVKNLDVHQIAQMEEYSIDDFFNTKQTRQVSVDNLYARGLFVQQRLADRTIVVTPITEFCVKDSNLNVITDNLDNVCSDFYPEKLDDPKYSTTLSDMPISQMGHYVDEFLPSNENTSLRKSIPSCSSSGNNDDSILEKSASTSEPEEVLTVTYSDTFENTLTAAENFTESQNKLFSETASVGHTMPRNIEAANMSMDVRKLDEMEVQLEDESGTSNDAKQNISEDIRMSVDTLADGTVVYTTTTHESYAAGRSITSVDNMHITDPKTLTIMALQRAPAGMFLWLVLH